MLCGEYFFLQAGRCSVKKRMRGDQNILVALTVLQKFICFSLFHLLQELTAFSGMK
jgi:hypothetical protein